LLLLLPLLYLLLPACTAACLPGMLGLDHLLMGNARFAFAVSVFCRLSRTAATCGRLRTGGLDLLCAEYAAGCCGAYRTDYSARGTRRFVPWERSWTDERTSAFPAG